MRTKTDHRFIVDVPSDQVLATLLAVERAPEWSPAHLDVRVASRDPQGRPLRVYATVAPTGRSDRQVIEYEYSPGRIAWTVIESGAGGGGGGWFEVEDLDSGGTEIWYHNELYLPIPMPGIMMKRTLTRIVDEAVHNLARLIRRSAGYPTGTFRVPVEYQQSHEETGDQGYYEDQRPNPFARPYPIEGIG
jgi:hypothetical protein